MEILKKPNNVKEPKIGQIISIVESIDNVHFQYIQRFFESSSNENNYYVDELLNEEYKIEQELMKAKAERETPVSSPVELKPPDENLLVASRKGSRKKSDNRHSFNVLKSAEKENEESSGRELYGGHKKSLSDEQNVHEQSLIDIVKAITNSMYNSRNIIYLRDVGSNWSDLSKAVNNEPVQKRYGEEDDDIDNLSEYSVDVLDFDGGNSEYHSFKNDRRSHGKEKNVIQKLDSEEINHIKDNSNVSRTTTDYLNYYNINDMEEKNENEESRKELKNAFDKIINSESHFSITSNNRGSKTIGISKAASLRRKLSSFHFVNSSSNNQ